MMIGMTVKPVDKKRVLCDIEEKEERLIPDPGTGM
jgi:hypothetical protein